VRRLLAAPLIVLLAACGGSGHPTSAKEVARHATPYVTPTTRRVQPTTTVIVKAPPTDAVALARKLGCVNPKRDASPENIDLGPKAISTVQCMIRGGPNIEIATYTPAAVAAMRGPILQATVCRLASGLGLTPPYYRVYGENFLAQIAVSFGATDPNYHAQSVALAKALGIKLTTTTCK
jgi:hypothetical protein